MTDAELTVLKHVWAMMITDGRITTGEWSYYGGRFEPVRGSPTDNERRKMQLLAEVKLLGVDWAKMDMPEYLERSEFLGTFAEKQGEAHTMLGTLYLLGGVTYMIGVNDVDAIYKHYAHTYKQVMDAKHLITSVFGEES